MTRSNDPTSRRIFLLTAAAASAIPPVHASEVPPGFPSQPPSLAREMVGAAHGRPERVRELLASKPTLANAAWDWGFGDWETALGAASHMGNREIAELLLSNGAHPTLFSATMLGELDVVKATIAARPDSVRTLGPHSLPLLAHARAGGAQSAAVVQYLEQIGGADGLKPVEISEEDLSKLTGDYVYGAGPNDSILIERKGKQLLFTRKGADARPLHHTGNRKFRPAGAPTVRVNFADTALLTVHDGDLIVKATRR